MLPELQYHDPSRPAWSLHNHLICSHGHCTVVVHVIICFGCFLFDCLQLIVFMLTPSRTSMCFYVQFWCCYYRLFAFISTWYSFVTRLWSLPSCFIANLSPMTFQFSPEITSLDYSWMQPIIVLNIYCSFSMSRRTLNLKWPSVLERVNLHTVAYDP